jgi:long-chain acyl-CoA synthetase
LAHGLRDAGIGRGKAVALWAPNSILWVASALAALAAGAMLVPIDDLAEFAEFESALKSSNARLVITTRRHLEAGSAIIQAQDAGAILVDQTDPTASNAKSWGSLLAESTDNLPDIFGDDPAMLCWTSGTTGSPKAFVLSHRNIATNVVALHKLAVVGPQDRVLLPLPLHHAYPFVVGMLTPLTSGTAIVLPAGATGPLLMRALREEGITALVGVPRLYEALAAAIGMRIATYSTAARAVWRAALRCVILLQQSTELHLGRLLFAPVRRAVAPNLRLLVSGGAKLEPGVEQQLEALGWLVLSGYGLAETASLFTGNRPGARRIGSAGRPLADGKLRISEPDADGIGEIELHGSSITLGYLNNPEANSAAFTPDGWFRTGDLGFVARDGFLFITGRIKETLVLAGGKKISPEDLERVYGDAQEIAEIAVLEDKGALVALVRPEPAKLYSHGATNLHDGIRVILGEKSQRLRSFQRLTGFALTSQPLPRTRLGKYRRFLLPALYAQAVAGRSVRVARAPTPEDEALLRNPTAAALWRMLQQRFRDQALDFDTSLGLDLNLDSFGWMELAIELDERGGVSLSDEDLSHIQTIRDLLRVAVAHQPGVGAVSPAPTGSVADIEYWLAPTAMLLTALGAVLYAINRLIMRGLFRLHVEGLERLPAVGPFVIAPNHVSYLDVLVVAAGLRWFRLRHAYWAGDARRFFPHRLGRVFCRAVHLFPVDAMHPSAALDTAHRVLAAGNILVWFPEGWRSPDGRLQHFLPGIGELLLRSGAPAVPAHVAGTFEALPRNRRVPRLRRLSLTFGEPARPVPLRASGTGGSDEERVADGLRRHLASLSATADRNNPVRSR